MEEGVELLNNCFCAKTFVVIMVGSSGASRRGCVNDLHSFCYVWLLCDKKQERNITPIFEIVNTGYHSYVLVLKNRQCIRVGDFFKTNYPLC